MAIESWTGFGSSGVIMTGTREDGESLWSCHGEKFGLAIYSYLSHANARDIYQMIEATGLPIYEDSCVWGALLEPKTLDRRGNTI